MLKNLGGGWIHPVISGHSWYLSHFLFHFYGIKIPTSSCIYFLWSWNVHVPGEIPWLTLLANGQPPMCLLRKFLHSQGPIPRQVAPPPLWARPKGVSTWDRPDPFGAGPRGILGAWLGWLMAEIFRSRGYPAGVNEEIDMENHRWFPFGNDLHTLIYWRVWGV